MDLTNLKVSVLAPDLAGGGGMRVYLISRVLQQLGCQVEVCGFAFGDRLYPEPQHPPATLLELLAAMASGADLAIASRHFARSRCQDWPWLRQLLSRGARWLSWLLLPQAVSRTSDPLSGYFLARREALVGCYLAPVGYKILLEVLAQARVQHLCDVGYTFRGRCAGYSKVTQQHYWDYLRHLLQLRSRKLSRRKVPTEL